MKVILMAPTPPPRGGMATWAERILSANLKNNWEVLLVDEKTINRKDAYEGANNYLTEAKRCCRIWRDLSKALRDKDAVVVHSNIPARTTSMMRELVSAIITKKRNKKFIVHFHCTVPNLVKTRFSKKLFCKLVKKCNCVYLLNNASADFLNKQSPNTKYMVIPNFIEVDNTYKKEETNNELKRFVYVGGVNEGKGCGLVAEVAAHFPDKEFRLVGHVDMDTSSFPQNVILLGEQDKSVVEEELRNADAFIFLTRYDGEGFSCSLLEAMSYSLPCVVSDWAANADMIGSNGGAVLKNYDLESAIDAINSIESPELRNKMGESNLNKIITMYSDKIVIDKYIDGYEMVTTKL